MLENLIEPITNWAATDSGKWTIAAIAWGEAAAVVGAAWFKGMIPLRSAAIASNVLGIMYGLATGNLPALAKHSINLPLNTARLREMQRLILKVREAGMTDFNFDWLKPFMHPASFSEAEVIFEKGAPADAAYLIVSGKVEIVERGRILEPGEIFGEMALFIESRKRTASARCVTDVSLLAITYEQYEQLYFQNPQFGLLLVRLVVERFEANHPDRELESS